ncbi:hypothetical protein E4U58_006444 [Claviceps cyperi]|nr:hypothetical protein E4U58_006444 [Claviceps cyperi]
MKARKAGQALEINGIAAAAELRRLQEKSLKRQESDERTLVVAKWGPISVLDARVRAAKDDNNRREAQEEEERRTRKEVRIEVGFLRHWLRAVRGTVRASLKKMAFGQIMLRATEEVADRLTHLDREVDEGTYVWCGAPDERGGESRRDR